jgi:N6-adenosine-specific RNA methylase IME4
MSNRAKKATKAKAGKPKTFKTLKAAARSLKAKATRPVRVTRGKDGKVKLDRATASQPDAMMKRLAPVVMEHPKGYPPRPANTRWLKEVKIGKRHRKDFGNLPDLAASIDARGALIQPIAIQPDDMLIAGERRMKAWPLTVFKDQPIPVRVITVDSIIAGEWDENAKRKDFTPTEAAKISEEIERQLATMAKQRQRAGTKADPQQKGKTGDVAARATGLARRTIDKAKAVVKAAEADPERFGKLQRDMDKSGKVDGPFKRLSVMLQKDAINNAPATLPMRGPYNAVVIDFPHPAEKVADQATIDKRGRAMRDYPEMSIEEGCKLFRSKEFHALLAPNVRIYFWTTNHHMDAAFVLLRAMGFDHHSTIGTWTKNKMGNGQVLRGKTEHCILAERGKPLTDIQKPAGGHWTTDWSGLGWDVREDSRKPDAFFDMVEHHTPSPRYAEIFSRGGRNDKWDCHGDQAGKFASSIAKAATPETEKSKKSAARRTLPGRDAALIDYASANGHVVSMTIDHGSDEHVATCACGKFQHRYKCIGRTGVKEFVEERMAARTAQDAAITEHWRAMRDQQTDASPTADEPAAKQSGGKGEGAAVAAFSTGRKRGGVASGIASAPAAPAEAKGEDEQLELPPFLDRRAEAPAKEAAE